MNIVYLNGEFVSKEKATISVFDRGFLFGDGIYEVIPVFDGKMFGFDAHYDRLENSLHSIHIPNTLQRDALKSMLKSLIERNNATQGPYNLYVQITRGTDQTRRHGFSAELIPTVVAMCTPSMSLPRERLAQGFSAIVLDDNRRRDCHIKSINLLPNVLMHDELEQSNALEAILVRNGEVMECTSSNVFFVKNNTIFTPPLSPAVLGGVTRDLILKLARANEMPCIEKSLTEKFIYEADEIWVTGSSKEICPIITINGKSVGTGKVGPAWSRMVDYYENYKQHNYD